jgi:hypothetical protein
MSFVERSATQGPLAQCPKGVRVSGMIWIISGVLIIAAPVIWIVYLVCAAAMKQGLKQALMGLVCDGWILAIALVPCGYVASLFVRVGLLHVRGRARDTLWLGICSLVVGLLVAGGWVMPFYHAVMGLLGGRVGAIPPSLVVLISLCGLLDGLCFLAAAWLSVVNRKSYLAWRQQVGP